MHQDIIFPVLIYVLCLLLVYIKSYTEEFTFTDPRDQIIRLYKSASLSIYQDHTVLHFVDRIDVDHMMGIFHQRAVQGDQVALCKQLI